MNEKVIESLKTECSLLNENLKFFILKTEQELDDPKNWYELVSFFLNTKNVMRHLTQRMTDSFSEMLLKPTSLDVVQPEDYAELLRVRVDQGVEKARTDLVANGREAWLGGEGMPIEDDLTNIKSRVISQRSVIEESEALLIEELKQVKIRKQSQVKSESLSSYDIRTDELLHQLLAYQAAVSEGKGLTLYMERAEKPKPKPVVQPQQQGRVAKTKKDEDDQKALLQASRMKLEKERMQQQTQIKLEHQVKMEHVKTEPQQQNYPHIQQQQVQFPQLLNNQQLPPQQIQLPQQRNQQQHHLQVDQQGAKRKRSS